MKFKEDFVDVSSVRSKPLRNRVLTYRYAAVLATGLLAVSSTAHSASLTETFTLPSPQTGASNVFTSSSFLLFDPSLGNLNSITFNITGSVTKFNPIPLNVMYYDTITYSNMSMPLVASAAINTPGASKSYLQGVSVISFTDTDTDAVDLARFTGLGSATISSIASTFFADFTIVYNPLSTITFNYTPNVLAAPGPTAGAGLLPLLGLTGVWFGSRRRKRASRRIAGESS